MLLQLNRLVVVDTDGRVEGVVSLSDILRRLVLSTADDSQTGDGGEFVSYTENSFSYCQ